MLKVTTGIVPEWYTPKEYEGKEKAPQFLLRPMTGPETLIAQDECYDVTKKSVTGKGYTQILGYGLKDWRNVFDEHETPVPYRGPSDINLLPFAMIAELAARVIAVSTFKEVDDGKN